MSLYKILKLFKKNAYVIINNSVRSEFLNFNEMLAFFCAFVDRSFEENDIFDFESRYFTLLHQIIVDNTSAITDLAS